jgi:REP element-mobilizing transposase RayT
MTRPKRPILPEATYFITCVTHARRPLFSNAALAKIVIEQWKHYETAYEFRLDAYSVLPDHSHVVLNVGKKKTISQILNSVNSYIATLINRQLGSAIKVRIWEERPWDEVIRDEEMYWQKVAYTLLNPWRAGLVKDPYDDYPYSNLREWLDREGQEFMQDLFGRYRRQAE